MTEDKDLKIYQEKCYLLGLGIIARSYWPWKNGVVPQRKQKEKCVSVAFFRSWMSLRSRIPKRSSENWQNFVAMVQNRNLHHHRFGLIPLKRQASVKKASEYDFGLFDWKCMPLGLRLRRCQEDHDILWIPLIKDNWQGRLKHLWHHHRWGKPLKTIQWSLPEIFAWERVVGVKTKWAKIDSWKPKTFIPGTIIVRSIIFNEDAVQKLEQSLSPPNEYHLANFFCIFFLL